MSSQVTKMPGTLDNEWDATVANVVPAVVTITTCTTLMFGMAEKFQGQATGMVVSTEHGLLLTNRHVIGEGPTESYAVFGSGACRCRIVPVYVDPIHDFAICKYNVSDLQNFTAKQIELKPELAKVGLEIRVFGNDTAEVLSILPGFISRIDRNPEWWDASKSTFTSSFMY